MYTIVEMTDGVQLREGLAGNRRNSVGWVLLHPPCLSAMV
jgi:hypothetical protein